MITANLFFLNHVEGPSCGSRWYSLPISKSALPAIKTVINQLECGPMPNVMVALPNIGGALCSTPQSLADAHCWCTVQ